MPHCLLRRGLPGLVRAAAPGSRLAAVTALARGTSSRMLKVQLCQPAGECGTVVVRWRAGSDHGDQARVICAEASVLRSVRAASIPVPAVLYVDAAGCYLGAPAVVLEYITGEVGLHPADPLAAAMELAGWLAAIHAVRPPAALDLRPVERPPGLADQGEQPVLLHGDFWPGNTIWQDGRLAAIVDWEDAAVGDGLADVANARLELTWFWGEAAADAFTRSYGASAGRSLAGLPAWDRHVAERKTTQIGRWGLPTATVDRMLLELNAFLRRAQQPYPR